MNKIPTWQIIFIQSQLGFLVYLEIFRLLSVAMRHKKKYQYNL